MLSSAYLIFAVGTVGLILACLGVRRPRIGTALCVLLFIPAPLFPTADSGWLFYGFAAFVSLVLTGWFIKLWFKAQPFESFTRKDNVGLSLALWFALSIFGLPLALVFNNGTIGEKTFFYVKGMVPFLYLLIFFVVRALPFDTREAKRVLQYVLINAIAFAALSFGIYAVTHARVISFYVPLAFPFIVLGIDVAFTRMLTAGSAAAVAYWALLSGVLTIAVLLNFTKAQVIVLMISLVLIMFLVSRHNSYRFAVRRSFVLLGLLSILASGALVLSSNDTQTSFVELVKTRLNDDSSGSTRIAELAEAFRQFTQSPIIGKGIGYQLERDVLGEPLTSGYVHNQVAYTAMTMGSAGLVLFALLVSSWSALLWRFKLLPVQRVATVAALHGCVLALVAYAEMFATFRTIQHNLLLGIFLALIVRLTPSSHEPIHEPISVAHAVRMPAPANPNLTI
jgi:O-antigen ligase